MQNDRTQEIEKKIKIFIQKKIFFFRKPYLEIEKNFHKLNTHNQNFPFITPTNIIPQPISTTINHIFHLKATIFQSHRRKNHDTRKKMYQFPAFGKNITHIRAHNSTNEPQVQEDFPEYTFDKVRYNGRVGLPRSTVNHKWLFYFVFGLEFGRFV